jgi:hypothetical protein
VSKRIGSLYRSGRSPHWVNWPAQTRRQGSMRAGQGILKVAREVGVGTGTVQRIKQEMTGPFAVAAA